MGTDALDQRQPRQRAGSYMAWISRLPCAACLMGGKYNTRVHVAHLRAGSPEHGKRDTGMAEKPDDAWTTPLCPPHHVGDTRVTQLSQHKMGELDFWRAVGIDPFDLCIALKAAYDEGRPGAPVIAAMVAQAKRIRCE